MEKPDSEYPDISDILARKTAGRRQRAALSFAEKLDILDALRERVRPIIEAREFRKRHRANRGDMSLAEAARPTRRR
jgi:hypothetical protein